eukprot:SAG31_NODE_311_length_17866_cov_7.010750_4_plen_58_part_00
MFGNFSISALHLSIKVPYFSNSGHKNEKVTPYLRHVWELLGVDHRVAQRVVLRPYKW